MHPRLVVSSALALLLTSGLAPVLAATTALSPVPPQAQLRVATVQVRVAPDHRDWTYRVGEPAKFTVSVVADNTPLDNATITYSVGPEMMPAPTQTIAVPPSGVVIDGGTMHVPGFLRCTVTAEFAGRTYKGVATAAYSPEQIVPYQTEPADFDAFWQAAKDELAATPIDAITTLLPERCTAKVNVYHVSFRVPSPAWMKTPARIYGILCEPKAPGRYPAVLKVPGAGVRPYSGDTGLAERGAIVLEIGVHGLPVNLAQEVYDQVYAGALNGYWLYNLDDPKTYYYRRIYQGCVRANDFLVSRENWDSKNLLVMGASQGGQLTIVTAGLDPRVTALAATHPAACDYTAELHGRAGGWPHPFKPLDDGSPSPQATPAKIATSAYYDTVNFARRVKAPGFYCWGYNDDVCPPTSVWAAFNVVTAPKQLAVTLELSHSYTPEQWEAINTWVCTTLGLK
jgi:cephalosporin-C deacetylase-like acetyl esterase